MRNVLLATVVAFCTAAAAPGYAAPHGENPTHNVFTGKGESDGPTSHTRDNPHWVPGYGDNRTCHGACLTAPFWNKLFGFVQYMHKHGI